MTRGLATIRALFPRAALPGGNPPTARSRPLSRGKSARAVLAGIAFIVLFHLGLNLALETIAPQLRDPEYGHRLADLRPRTKQGKHPVIVALGSSRSQMGLSPDHLGLGDDAVVYNFSQAGCGPVGEWLNLERLLAAGVTPDMVLVEILPPVLGGESPAEKLVIPSRLSWADVKRLEPYCTDPASLKEKWATARLSPWSEYRLLLVSHVAGSLLHWQSRQDFMWKQMKPGGWMPYFFSEISEEKRADGLAKAKGQYVPYFHDFHRTELPQRAYRDLIARCQERGIRVAFYAMPESATFQSWYTPAARAAIAAYFDELRAAGIPVFDMRTWIPDETAYADGHHMLRSTAEAFSARFGAEYLRPWLATR